MEESKTSAVSKKEAYIYSAVSPDATQKKRFEAFLLKEQGEEFELVWKKDETVGNGFRLEAGGEVYDWTREGRYRQLASGVSLRKSSFPASRSGRSSFCRCSTLRRRASYTAPKSSRAAISR